MDETNAKLDDPIFGRGGYYAAVAEQLVFDNHALTPAPKIRFPNPLSSVVSLPDAKVYRKIRDKAAD